jgi:GNAT superfamily N-acetyltransferase
MAAPAYGLRPSTPEDLPFVLALNKANAVADVEHAIAWDEEAARAQVQRRFRPGRDWLVTKHGERIGLLSLDRRADAIVVRHIELLPEHQNRGIGSALIRGVLDFGAAQKLPVRLRVAKESPARSLYARLGFAVTAEDDRKVEMTATPTGPAP